MPSQTRGSVARPERGSATSPTITGPDGRRIRLEDLPLIAYRLNCGHVGKGYGIARRDVIFCDSCGADKSVKDIISG